MRCTLLNRAKTSRHTRTDKASLAHYGARQRFKKPRRAVGPSAQTTLPMRCTPLNRAKTSRHTRTDKASLALHGARQRFNPPSVPSGRRRKLLCRCAAPPLNRATIFWRARTDKVALAHHGARQRFKRPPARRGTGGANYSADALRPPEQGKDLPARANGLRRSRASWRAATLQKTPGAPSGRRRKPLGKLTVTRSASACGQGCDEPLGPSLLRDLDGDGGRRNLHSPHRSVPQASASRRRRFFMTAADVKKPLTGRSKDRPSVGPHNGVSCLVLYFPYTPCLKQNFKLSTVITAKPSRSSRRRKSYRQAWRSFAGAPAMGSCAIPPGARWAGAFFTACFCSVLCCHA